MTGSNREEWRPVPIPGLGDTYSVSNWGRVRSEDRTITVRGRGVKRCKGRTLRPAVGNTIGHLKVGLHKDGAQVGFWVHRLVAGAFLGDPPDGRNECRHLNGDPADNRVENLAWGNRSENTRDTVRHGRNRNAAKTHCKRGHPLSGPNCGKSSGGGRSCRACQIGRGRLAYRPGTLQELSDEAFTEIVLI